MEENITKQNFQREALSEFKTVISLLAGFSYAGLIILITNHQSNVFYTLAYICACLASVALIGAAFIAAMLSTAFNLRPIEDQPLKFTSRLLGFFGFGGIALFLVEIVLLSFTVSMVVGIITILSILLLSVLALLAFFRLNRHFSSKRKYNR